MFNKNLFRLIAILFVLLSTAACSSPAPENNVVDSQIPTEEEAPYFNFEYPTSGANIPVDVLTAKGNHNLDTDTFVWIFLHDLYAGYYLQNPPVKLIGDGTWRAANIRLGPEITALVAVEVDSSGDALIRSWVQNQRWGRIDLEELETLSGYHELAWLDITTPSVN